VPALLGPLLLTLLVLLAGAARAEGLAVLMAGESCPDASISRAIEKHRARPPLISHYRVTAAVARTRAERALGEARRLYTRTNFAGCISLLSISELELGRSLADPDPNLRNRAHRLLADVVLWLGICQWASGEPQAAATSFVRSAQLPSGPTPDPRLLPPEVVEAYRSAVTAPRHQVSCQLDPPLKAHDLVVDGKGPTVGNGNTITVPAGSHYLVLKADCMESPECTALRSQLGPEGMRSLRLEAGPHRCRIQVPAIRQERRLTCINVTESEDAGFVASVTQEARASRTLVVTQTGHKVALRLHRAGASSFQHQLVSNLGQAETPSQVVGRSTALLFGGQGAVQPPPPPPGGDQKVAWYRKWWVWAIVGGAVAVVTTTAVVATAGDDRVRVVFGP